MTLCAIPLKAAYGPQVKKMCPKRINNGRTKEIGSLKRSKVMKPAYYILDVKRQIQRHILRVIT
jgi:hypothetical protein